MSADLPRSGFFGIAPESTEENGEVVIQRIVPSSTASQLGLKVGDKLVKVNDLKINSFSNVLTVVQENAAGSTLKVSVIRDGEPQILSGKMLARPKETSDIARVKYGVVEHGKDRLRSIIHTPLSIEEDEAAPTIFFIQGYTCSSIDYGMMPNVTTLQLVNQFVEAGYQVFRMEKPGIGDSQSVKGCADISFEEENNAFLSGLRMLKQHKAVDKDRIYIWGHSLGMLHAGVLGNKEKVAGVIGYGGVYKNWYDYMLDIYQVQSVKHFGVSPEQAKNNVELITPFLNLLLNTNTPWNDIVDNSDTKRAIEAGLVTVDGDRYFTRHYSFFRSLNGYNFSELWQNISAPVLMIYGSLDIQAIEPSWTEQVVNVNKNNKSLALVLEGAEHAFMRYKNQQEYQSARESGAFNPIEPNGKFDERIGNKTIEWLAKL